MGLIICLGYLTWPDISTLLNLFQDHLVIDSGELNYGPLTCMWKGVGSESKEGRVLNIGNLRLWYACGVP